MPRLLVAIPFAALSMAALDAHADRVRVTITGTVESASFSRGPFVSARAGQRATAVFEVDSNAFRDSAQYPVRGYTIDPASLTLTVGTGSTGMRSPLPAGSTPLFVLRDNDPAVDGFYITSGILEYPGSIPLNSGSTTSMSMTFSRGFDVGTILRSRNILDAAPGRWGFEHIASYDWSVGMQGAAPMMLTYETIAIDNLTNPPRCPADYNQDGGVDGADVEAFFVDWQDGLLPADVNQDGGVDGADVQTFFTLWAAGGC
ncbi:MAG: GC-type dockerin domain-anchored protein [Phycisphaerae bacterium]